MTFCAVRRKATLKGWGTGAGSAAFAAVLAHNSASAAVPGIVQRERGYWESVQIARSHSSRNRESRERVLDRRQVRGSLIMLAGVVLLILFTLPSLIWGESVVSVLRVYFLTGICCQKSKQHAGIDLIMLSQSEPMMYWWRVPRRVRAHPGLGRWRFLPYPPHSRRGHTRHPEEYPPP